MPPSPALRYRLGDRRVDCTRRTLVVGVLDPVPGTDELVRAAATFVDDGADLLEVSGHPEPDRVAPSIAALVARFAIPIACATSTAAVLEAACDAGALVGVDCSGFADPGYLAVAAARDVSVAGVGLDALSGSPALRCDRFPDDATAVLLDRARRAETAGLARDRIALGAGFTSDAPEPLRTLALRSTGAFVALGYPLVLTATDTASRATALASVAYAVAHGCRIVRVRDVAGAVQVCRTVEAILDAGEESSG